MREDCRIADGDIAGWRGLGPLEMGVGKTMLGGRGLLSKSARMGTCRKYARKSVSAPPSIGFILSFSCPALKRAIVS